MKVKLIYLHENREKELKLILSNYYNFEKFMDEMSFYRVAFDNVCNNQPNCDGCHYSKYEAEDKCFNEYLRENDIEVEFK